MASLLLRGGGGCTSKAPRPEDEVATGKDEVATVAEAIARAAEVDREFRALGGGCEIEKTEERAISLVQLEAVEANVERRCEKEKWKGGRPDGTDAEGKPKWKTVALTPETVNLYDADKYLIKPVTVARRCSLVEVLAAGPQPPDWFVSHFWGEPIKEFVACIKRHSADRLLGFNMEGEPAQPGVHTTRYGKHEVKAPGLYWVRSAAPFPSPPLPHAARTDPPPLPICRSARTPTTSGTSRRP